MPTTGDVLDQHLKCFGENDLDGVLADYSFDAVLFVPGRPLKGPNAIKPFFQAFFSEFAKPGASFSMRQRFVEGDYAYLLWSAETASKWRKHTCLWFKLKLIEDAFTPTAKKEIVSNLTDAMVWSTHNRGGDELTVVSSEYLEVVPVKA